LNSKITVDEEGNIDTHDKIDPTSESDLDKNLYDFAPSPPKIKAVRVQGKLNASVCRAFKW